MNILILFGHPAFQRSNANHVLIEGIEKIKNVTFHDLYEVYPEMDIDIDAEQQLMLQHDVIIFQHPMYWYSAPAIFKEWQDLVLEHGWAYGSQGTSLQGKYFFSAITTGASAWAFNNGEFQNHTIKEFLVPYQQMAAICKMTFLPPFVIHGTHNIERKELLEARQTYHTLLNKLANDEIDLEKALDVHYLNDFCPNCKMSNNTL